MSAVTPARRRPSEPPVTSFLVPGVVAAVVAIFSLTLLAIGARSPYTHANLLSGYDARYDRTEQILVGAPIADHGFGDSPVARLRDDPAAWGARLFVVKACAGCHALEGAGGAVGPRLMRLTLTNFQNRTRQGPAGMPSYSTEALTDEELLAIIGYLRGLREASRPATPTGEGFRDAVLPLLQQECMSCHALRGKGGFSILDRESILRGGETGPAVVPWDAEASLVIQKLRPSPPVGERMPLEAEPLPEEVIDRIVQWIERGAPDD